MSNIRSALADVTGTRALAAAVLKQALEDWAGDGRAWFTDHPDVVAGWCAAAGIDSECFYRMLKKYLVARYGRRVAAELRMPGERKVSA